jgi:hypothetical protein
MVRGKAHFILAGVLALTGAAAQAQTAQQVIQLAADTELAADHNDHYNWIFLEESDKPKEHLLQWVAATQRGSVERVLEKDEHPLPESEQREAIQKFLHDPKAQNKQVAEAKHDDQQIDDLLKLLPEAFIWTKTGETDTTISLHFDPAPNFHPPTREARVFSSMTGDLFHDVTFGGGLLGRLKEKSSFALEQQQVAPSIWELTAIHVHLEGNALLFKSVSLQQDDKRSRFQTQPGDESLEQAAIVVMNQPELFACSEPGAGTPCMEKLVMGTKLKP